MPFLWRDVAQLGSALRSGRRGRWFESSHPDLLGKKYMLLLSQDDSLSLVESERKRAIASLDEGKAVIPVWLDVIYQRLNNTLNERNKSA